MPPDLEDHLVLANATYGQKETIGPKADNDPLSDQLRKKRPWHHLSPNVQHTGLTAGRFEPKLFIASKHHSDMTRTYESGETHEFHNSSLSVFENCEHQRKRARACHNDSELCLTTQHEPHNIQWRLIQSRCHPRGVIPQSGRASRRK